MITLRGSSFDEKPICDVFEISLLHNQGEVVRDGPPGLAEGVDVPGLGEVVRLGAGGDDGPPHQLHQGGVLLLVAVQQRPEEHRTILRTSNKKVFLRKLTDIREFWIVNEFVCSNGKSAM